MQPLSGIYSGSNPLDSHLETRLLLVLSSEEYKGISFRNICNSLVDDKGELVFGFAGSETRRKAQRRRDYLLRYPTLLKRLLKDLVASPSVEISTPCSNKKAETVQSHHQVTPVKLQFSSMGTDRNRNLERQLVFNRPWECPDGIICLRMREVHINNTICNKVRINIPIYNLSDWNDDLYKAKLTTAGDGLLLTAPVSPKHLRNRDNVDEICDCIDGENGSAHEDRKLYEGVTQAIKDGRAPKTVEILYKFPPDVTCSNKITIDLKVLLKYIKQQFILTSFHSKSKQKHFLETQQLIVELHSGMALKRRIF